MLALTSLSRDLLRSLRDHLRPLVAYHLFFTVLASSLLLPAVAWSLVGLVGRFGRTVISGAELLDLLLSPAGTLWLLAAIGLTFLVLYLQQAGMILVAARPRDRHVRLAFEALWWSLHRLPALAGLVVIQVGTHLLLVLPVALTLVWLHGALLGGLDPYYVQRVRPPALWQFLALALPLVAAWAWLAASLYVRWILALPLVALEALSPRRALLHSSRITRGKRRSIAAISLVLLALILILPILVTLAFDWLITPLLWWLPERNAVLIPATLAYLTAYVLVTLAITFAGIAANALLSTCLYLRLTHREARPAPPPADAHPGRLAWVVELGVVLFAVWQAWLIVNSFTLQDEVTVIAHRGSSLDAPENTLPAIHRALDDGADMVELDVRLTRDHQVVLYHDSSLQRLTGDPRRIGELERETLANVDVGSWFGDPFVGESIPGLDEALAAVRGRSGLMIDLKTDPGREEALVDAVVAALQEEQAARLRCLTEAVAGTTTQATAVQTCGNPDVTAETRLATTSPRLARTIQSRYPEQRVTLLAQLILPGSLERRRLDALGLRHNRIDEQEVRLAKRYGYELHAWTTNKRSRMSQLIDMGVDAIITDRPALLAELIAERRELGDGALLLIKLHNWLRQ
ncbi:MULTISPECIES: glycerophosphodiester phosphodiesterase family protein [unclassified Halomonas]|uniref:glycerophosphodiester phosphodiesterase family protein n=1 Tax=unclassified Halomonas TaxID=2609666 RepID=UPI0028886514|nr:MULTISPECIES: glycerophosphodiester phosphodiesterase family protein [unclassified Halomonas]MDT0510698.1 glycerophosphodiester phosphodiesterase family protein [Halomonas sp. LES1]MDT0592289.1 glycerophosphodiester phosphodiesterase family protein [Halomonas sp. PAR8]